MANDQKNPAGDEPGLGIHIDEYAAAWAEGEEGEGKVTDGEAMRRKARADLDAEAREFAAAFKDDSESA